jgi:protoporphyrinogen IX oxidase
MTDVLWLKTIHITAVILWAGTLLYLPTAIVTAPRAAADEKLRPLPRLLFIAAATPAALLAIASGTAIFTWQGPLAGWLAGKLALVGLLVLGHAACGWMVLRGERGSTRLKWPCAAVTAASVVWLGGIAWLVLEKPF